MRFKSVLTGLVGASTLAPWGSFALEPDELFQKASQSIVAIHGFDTRIKPFTYGSGVVIAPETVITNCHVLAKTRSILVKRGNATFKATLQYPDVERDLCQLSVPDLNAPAVTLGNSTAIRIGQRAFAIGNPIGLELTLSDGLISGFRKMEGSDVPRIQTSAPALRPGRQSHWHHDADWSRRAEHHDRAPRGMGPRGPRAWKGRPRASRAPGRTQRRIRISTPVDGRGAGCPFPDFEKHRGEVPEKPGVSRFSSGQPIRHLAYEPAQSG
jgi:hypothetical protein